MLTLVSSAKPTTTTTRKSCASRRYVQNFRTDAPQIRELRLLRSLIFAQTMKKRSVDRSGGSQKSPRATLTVWRIFGGVQSCTKGANWMRCAAWHYVRGDLASTRRDAAAFLDNLDVIDRLIGRQVWATSWTNIGEAHCRVADLRVGGGAFDEATEAWLSALTAFEVARRLDEDPQQRDQVSTKFEAAIQRLGSMGLRLERVQIADGDQEFQAYFVSAAGPELRVPSVICISNEEELGTTLLRRVLPVVTDRGMSILVVSHDDVSNHWRGQAETLLSCCLDYLSGRPDVDPIRIGVYGDGLSAVLATDFAVSDKRIAAAVCDGGLWNWARTLASVRWMTGTADLVDEDLASVRRSRLVRQLRCPVLVLVGGCGAVSASEAVKLQADCRKAHVDLELVTLRTSWSSSKRIENFVTSDDCVFGWLERKLKHGSGSPLSRYWPIPSVQPTTYGNREGACG